MVVESAKSLATCGAASCQCAFRLWHVRERLSLYLSDPADVLLAVLGREAQVLVQPEAHVIAVEPVRRQAELEEVLLQRRRNGRLAGRRQTSEPDGASLLLAELAALAASEAGVPGDVAALVSGLCVQRERAGVDVRCHCRCCGVFGIDRWCTEGCLRRENDISTGQHPHQKGRCMLGAQCGPATPGSRTLRDLRRFLPRPFFLAGSSTACLNDVASVVEDISNTDRAFHTATSRSHTPWAAHPCPPTSEQSIRRRTARLDLDKQPRQP